ncbi:hypothetical protein GQ53DRAFT_820893 [Thozetella sp. PMI_491]|nr:hypothetical protein GQ53DRAFT_820893 [Thozetella sp. PMI_491]
MAAVLSMMQYERLRREYQRGLIHFEAIRRMIELRGGMLGLICTQPKLAQKVFKADLEFALDLGSPTFFDVEHHPGHEAVGLLRGSFFRENKLASYNFQILEKAGIQLQDVLFDIWSFASLLNAINTKRAKFALHTFYDVIAFIGYRLVKIRPLSGARLTSHWDDAIHLSLLSLTMSCYIGPQKVSEYTILAEQIRISMQSLLGQGTKDNELILWLLFVNRIAALGPEDDAWMIPKIKIAGQILGVTEWQGVRETLRKFPWIDALFDEAGEAIWMQVEG